MKKRSLCTLLWLCFAFSVRAQQITPKLFAAADMVLRGQVTFVKAFQRNDGQIFTKVVINPELWYRGKAQSTLMLELPGGVLENQALWVSHTPNFQVEESIVLFYNTKQQSVVEGVLGKYTLQSDFVPQEKMQLRDFDRLMLSYAQNPQQDWEQLKAKFEVHFAPKTSATITSFTPNSAAAGGGQLISISGTGFGAVQGTGKVEFNRDGSNRVTANVLNWSDTLIQVTVPAGASSGSIKVSPETGTPVFSSTDFNLSFGINNRRWGGASVTIAYRINPNTLDASGEETAVQNAMNTWNTVNSNFQFAYGGLGAATSSTPNGINDIYWVANIDGAGGIVARNWNYYDPATGTVYESDIEFDESETWALSAMPGTQDVETVALHELGHSVHLSDYYHANDNAKVMYGIAAAGVLKRDLHAADLDGLSHLYQTPTPLVSPARGNHWTSGGAQILATIDKPEFAAGATSDHLTIEAWVYPTAIPATGAVAIVAQTRGTLNRAFELMLNSAGKVEFRCSLNGTSVTTVTSTNSLALNTWTHVRGVFRKSTSANRFAYIVINGWNEASAFVGNSALFDSGANLTIGGYFNASGALSAVFEGKIDEVHLSATSRIRSTVTPSTAATAASVPATASGDSHTRALWKFDEAVTSKNATTPQYLDYSGLSTSGNATMTQTATYLAVQLGTFTASINADAIRLEWLTHSETDFYGFEVQHHIGSKTGNNYESLAFLPSAGTEGALTRYSYPLFDMAAGYHTFRLKLLDKDGTVNYSDEIVVLNELPNAFALSDAYPNPFQSQTEIKISVAQSQMVKIELFNMLGQKIKTLFQGNLTANEPKTLQILGNGIANGMYFVKFKGQTFEATTEITRID